MQALFQEVTHVFGGPLSRFCMRVILRSQPQPSILQAAFPSSEGGCERPAAVAGATIVSRQSSLLNLAGRLQNVSLAQHQQQQKTKQYQQHAESDNRMVRVAYATFGDNISLKCFCFASLYSNDSQGSQQYYTKVRRIGTPKLYRSTTGMQHTTL